MSHNIELARLSKIGIDAKTLGATAIGTTENGTRRFYPLYLIVNCSAANTVAVVAALSIGTNSTAFDNLLAITALTGLTTANMSIQVPIVLATGTIAANTSVSVKLTTVATATSQTIDVH